MKKKINNKALQIKGKPNSKENINTKLDDIDYDDKNGKLAFEFVSHNNCSLSEWQGQELKLLIEAFKKIEKLSWTKIFKDQGLNWERNKNIAIQLPSNIPPDAKLYSFRVNQKMRVYGYRVQEFFYIIWFDKNHIVCPVGRPKKYTA